MEQQRTCHLGFKMAAKMVVKVSWWRLFELGRLELFYLCQFFFSLHSGCRFLVLVVS